MKKVKKFFAFVIAAAVLLSSLGITALAEGGEDFTVVSGVLTAYTGSGGDVVIPDDLGITSIADEVFSGFASLTSVVVPSGVTSIGEKVFYNCTNMTSVSLPDGLTYIGDYAFYYCSSLTSVSVPASVAAVGKYVFADSGITDPVLISGGTTLCYVPPSYSSYTIPGTVTSINGGAFWNCESLTALALPDSVTSVGDYAFRRCTGLTSLTLSSNLESIGEFAFSACSGLTSIVLPDSVMSLGKSAFSGCTSLTSVTFPAGITSIPDYLFDHCSGMTSLTLPTSVTSIGKYAFTSCSGLTSITLPAGLELIGEYALYYCTALSSVTIPASVTSIGDDAFDYCSSLSSAIFEGDAPTMGYYVFWHAVSSFVVYYYSGAAGFATPEWTTGYLTYDTVELSSGDTTAPALTGYSAWRSGATTAALRFISDEDGSCYYQITESETPPADVVSGGMDGGEVTADAAATVSPAGLTSGAKYAHLVVEDASGNVSDALTIPLPYDYYYSENFESYPLGTYIASGDMSPITQINCGTGDANQKVAENVSNAAEKMLSLSSGGSWASDQAVVLDGTALAAAERCVFEGDVYTLGTSGWQLRFSFTTGTYSASTEAGVYFKNGNIVSISNSERVLQSGYNANQWYHIKIEAFPADGTYSVYVDGVLLDDTLTLPSGIKWLAITAGHGYTAYFDNLRFYTAEAEEITHFSGGTGSEADPYLISTEADLFEFAQLANDGDTFAGKYFSQTADIALTGSWPPIDEFAGSYDGQGYAIENLSINLPSSSYVGLFRETGSGTALENIRLVGADISGGSYLGALVGDDSGAAITSCSVSGSVEGDDYTGGLVGHSDGATITDCSVSGSVKGDGSTGGLVGYSDSAAINGCSFSGSVEGCNRTGGLVGENEYGGISNCSAACELYGSNNYAGGLVGDNYNASISNSFACGDVTCEYCAGGLIGYNDYFAPVTNCYAAGSVEGSAESSDYIGGLVGYNDRSCSISGCFTSGSVSGYDDVGGLAGYNSDSSSLIKCYTACTVSGGTACVGYIAGSSYGTVSGCYYLDEVSGDETGPGLTAAAMALQESFDGWDFDTTWQISVDGSYDYPTLALGGAIRSTAGAGGSVSPFGIACLASGGSQTYTIAPEAGYVVGDVLVNGASVGDVSSYTFTGVHTSHTIEASFEAAFDGGSGTEADPYQVATAEQLDHVRAYPDSYFIQTENIYLDDYLAEDGDGYNSGAGWEPIGTDGDQFAGSYDGQDKVIGNLTIDREMDYVGLFGSLSADAELKNILLSDIRVAGAGYVGGLAGSSEGSITDCFAEGSVTGSAGGSGRYNGGLVGQNLGTISGGSYEGSVTSDDYIVGGFVGLNRGVIENVTIDNISVSCTDSEVQDAGGLAGRNLPQNDGSGYDLDTGIIKSCHVGANAVISGYACVAGLVGENTYGVIENSSSQAAASGTYRVGGIVGSNSGTVRECFSAGSVTGSDIYNGDNGGLIGYSYGEAEDCYSFTSVSGPYRIGGLVGRNSGTLTNCYSAGVVTGTGSAEDIGGLIGYQQGGTVTSCYWDYQASTQSSSDAGTSCTTAAMKEQATFSGWDFTDIWTIDAGSNDGYPALAWQESGSGASSDASLSGLTALGIDLAPGFSSETTSYSASAANSVGSTTVTAITGDAAASVTINGTEGTSKAVTLSVGSNTISVVVTAEDNVTTETYTITIVRASSGFTSGGGSSTNEDKTGSIEIKTTDGSTTATGTVTDIDNGVSISIPPDQFDLLSGTEQSVTLETDTVTVSFNAVAVDYIDSAAGGNEVVLEIVLADSADLSEENQQLIGDRPVYEFSLTAGGNTISSFGGGMATVSIPYALQSGEDPNAVVVYYIDGSGSLVTVTGQYNSETGTVIFMAEHFSIYAVGYHYVNFSDVDDTSWYYDAVTFCAAREITMGTGDGLFSPDTTLTRGQLLVMLMRAYGIEADENITDNFDDAGDTYYTGYLAASKRLGISNGVGGNRFAPDTEITRQDMFTLLYRALNVLGKLPEKGIGTTLNDFSDAAEISDYALTAMNTLVKAGIVSGSGGKLDPQGGSTRAQMAQVLYNLLSE